MLGHFRTGKYMLRQVRTIYAWLGQVKSFTRSKEMLREDWLGLVRLGQVRSVYVSFGQVWIILFRLGQASSGNFRLSLFRSG
jgi:hypothetical protein